MALVWCSVQFQGSTSTIQTDWNNKLQSMLMGNTQKAKKNISAIKTQVWLKFLYVIFMTVQMLG